MPTGASSRRSRTSASTSGLGRKEISASQLAQRLGFTGGRQQTRVSDLSGGERRRLQLTRLLMDEPNVLLLDEPTNDLDIETLTSLEDVLDGWAGTLLVVSHDRYLLERACDRRSRCSATARCASCPAGSSSTSSCGTQRPPRRSLPARPRRSSTGSHPAERRLQRVRRRPADRRLRAVGSPGRAARGAQGHGAGREAAGPAGPARGADPRRRWPSRPPTTPRC